LVASGAGLGAVFLVSMLVVLCAADVALPLISAALARHGKQKTRLAEEIAKDVMDVLK
jgi:hypothetical protein